MCRTNKSKENNMRVELKYCEHCGALWVREGGGGVYCGKCEPKVAEPAIDDDYEKERRRRIYRARTVTMLRRYMRYSIETGRLPSILGGEFFRAKITSYTVVTFEDRVIFVHDMETCLNRLDGFSREL